MFSKKTQALIDSLRAGIEITDAQAAKIRDELTPVLNDISARLFTDDHAAAVEQQKVTGEIVALLQANHFRRPNAVRQAALKIRREAAGFKRTTVWIHQPSFDAGKLAAELGSTNASGCPPEHDRMSWMLGYCEHLDKAAMAREAAQAKG